MSLVLAVIAALAAPAASDPAWESYACEGGPTIRLALAGDRPAERGWLQTADGVVELTRHEGEAKAVLRGGGHMVRPFHWLDVLYAPPGEGQAAFTCRVQNAVGRVAAPGVE